MSSDTTSNSKKRKLENPGEHTNEHPEAARSKITKISKNSPAGTEAFIWLDAIGPAKSCLHGVNLNPSSSEKVAAFDLDGTLIKWNFASPKGASAIWEWWKASVPVTLKELHESGYAIVIISNQAIKPLALKSWKQKVASIATALPQVPFRLFAATSKDNYRKPMPGIWTELERIYNQERVNVDKNASFFVGDAAGRRYTGGRSDFSSTDRKWALNVGISFFTPEEYFLKHPPHTSFVLPGFHVSSLLDLPPFTPSSTPLISSPMMQEVIIFVGYPCLGKTSLFRRVFEPVGYVHINQDTLRSRNKCLTEMKRALQERKSCVIDNTNRDSSTRKQYIDAARQMEVPTRCFIFTGSIELAWHNNLYRAYNRPPSLALQEPKRDLVPYMAFSSFRDNFEEPDTSEGISEIKKINWVFRGNEEEKRHWSMWLQIDGK